MKVTCAVYCSAGCAYDHDVEVDEQLPLSELAREVAKNFPPGTCGCMGEICTVASVTIRPDLVTVAVELAGRRADVDQAIAELRSNIEYDRLAVTVKS